MIRLGRAPTIINTGLIAFGIGSGVSMINKVLTDDSKIKETIDLVCGVWVSQWGLVTLDFAAATPELIAVTGYWGSAENKKGIIHNGAFDPASGMLQINYTEIYKGAIGYGTFSGQSGELNFSFDEELHSRNGCARLVLSQDGKQFTGVFCEIGYGNKGNWTMNRLDFPQTPSRFPGISGHWQSDWGAVFLKQRNSAVVGVWNEGTENEIRILDGHYDAERGVFSFNYFDVQRNRKGEALLVLAADGSALSGTWAEPPEAGHLTLMQTNEPALEPS